MADHRAGDHPKCLAESAGERYRGDCPDQGRNLAKTWTPGSPVIAIHEAQHHLTLDQPMAFITAVRAVLDNW
jgi:hypothetical protein